MNPTTFQSLLQHTQVIHDQHPLPKQLHTPVRQPEPSYHLLSHQHTRQPCSYRHESDIPPVGPPQEVTSQGYLYNTFFFVCFSAVLGSATVLIVFLLCHQLLHAISTENAHTLYKMVYPQVLALRLENKIKSCTFHLKVK